jgi:hypothetical protein
MEPKLIPIKLDTIADGALREAFDLELAKVLANIADVNTAAEAKRELVLKLQFIPRSDRTEMETVFVCTSKLASIEAHHGRMFMGKDKDGNFYGFNQDPRQQILFDPPTRATTNVTEFSPVAADGKSRGGGL